LRTSIVVPTFNRRDRLPAVVESLIAQPADEIVVVVDGSRDGSIEYLHGRASEDRRLRPVWTENGGEGRARQRGAGVASGELLLFLDDDVEPLPGLVEGHRRHHVARGGLVVLGYMPTAGTGFASRLYSQEYERRCASYQREPQLVLRHFWAGNFSMRRSDALSVGLFSDRFTERYHPDREFGLRCLDAGLEGVFDRAPAARHHHERSLAAFRRDARSQGAGRRQLAHLHPAAAGGDGERQFLDGLPPLLPALVAAARRPRAYAIASSALHAAVRAAGAAGASAIELAAARTLRRLEQLRGWRVGSV